MAGDFTNTSAIGAKAVGTFTWGEGGAAILNLAAALIRVEPGVGVSGSLVTVSGEGFLSFERLELIEFGGLGVLGGRTVFTDVNGDFTVTDVVVPSLGPRIHTVRVEVGIGASRTLASTSFEVLEEPGNGPAGSLVTVIGGGSGVSDSTIVANQNLTISGSGFSEAIGGEDFCIVEGDITLNNVALEFADDNNCPNSILNAAGASEGILLDTGGTFTLTVRVHDVVGSNPALNTALLQEGSHELKVIDTNGAEGTLLVPIAERSLELTPLAAGPGDLVTIDGQRFIAANPDGLSAEVVIKYRCGTSSKTVMTDPDVSGNFQQTLTIPSGCAIPSTNTLSADILAGGFVTGVVETITHEIPEATCSPPGSGVWTVAVNCTFQGSATTPGNVIVEAGIALTIDTGASLNIDFTNFHLLIRDGAKVVIRDGGKIF